MGGKATTKARIAGAGGGLQLAGASAPQPGASFRFLSCIPAGPASTWSCALHSELQREPSCCSGAGRNAQIPSRDQPSGLEEMRAIPGGERGCENPAVAGVAWSSSLNQPGKAGGKGTQVSGWGWNELWGGREAKDEQADERWQRWQQRRRTPALSQGFPHCSVARK